MKFAVNRLLTCILYCAPGPTTIRTVRKYSTVDRFLSRMTYLVLVSFSSGDAVALLRESYTFVKRHSKVSCSYLIELMLLLLNVLDHLVSIRKNRRQFVNISEHNSNVPPCLSFHVLT